MASLISMNFTQFVSDFIINYDYTKHSIIIISKDINGSLKDNRRNTESKYDNVDFAPDLFPLPQLVGYLYDGKREMFEEGYLTQLDNMSSEIGRDIWSIVDMIVNDDEDVVILYSDAETNMKFTEVLFDYIDSTYKISGIPYEDYKKFGGYDKIIDKIECNRLLDSNKLLLEQEHETIIFNRFMETLEDKFREVLSGRTLDELRDYCRSRNLFVKRTLDKEQTIDYIIDRLTIQEEN